MPVNFACGYLNRLAIIPDYNKLFARFELEMTFVNGYVANSFEQY